MNGEGPGGGICAVHHDALAAFECEGCGALLCGDCVNEGKYLTTCGLCSEVARPLPGMASPVRGAPSAGRAPVSSPEADVAVQLTNHVIVPGAITAMVTAILFFLVDVRSIFLPMGFTLKWLGFWFVLASVLIARYGRLSGDRDRQGCYTFALGAAMALALILEPWEMTGSGGAGILVNVAIVAVVWRYATRLTASLSREGEAEPPVKKGLRLFGVERLRFEAWERQQDDARLEAKRRERKAAEAKRKADAHGNPSAAVARLAAGALLVFAMAEPLILAGEPEVGERALAAVVVFLFASGLVLAAGSAVGTLRHARLREGQVSEGLVPARVATAGLVMIVLLALTLAVPGITYRGSGELRPEPAAQGAQWEGGDRPAEEDPEGQGETRPQRSQRSGEQGGESREGGRPRTGAEQTLTAATSMLDGLASLGKFLFLPFVIALVLGGLYVLSRLAPFLAKMKLSGWRAWLARLAAVFARRKPEEKRSGKPVRAGLDLDGLGGLPPRECVVESYTRLLRSLEALGYELERRTPYEYLAGLPAHLGRIRKPFDALTSAYVRAAYSAEEVAERDRREVVSAMAEIKSRLPA